MKKKKNIDNVITKNKKAYFDYEILDNWEAGIELRGYETKSIRNGHVNLKGAYVIVINGELYVKGMHISAWKALPNRESIETERVRKIYLHKKTITFLIGKLKEAGYSIIPLELYFVGSLIKLRVGLAKGKKAYQKKQVLKERTMDKEAKIALKKYV
ncbi:MAG: SsrA-binding protein SmpB [Candidatus Gracilibacteria bacterium]|nr:SsrA-binding protein SmpB [Candidatus Gracilibacteria bacterium]